MYIDAFVRVDCPHTVISDFEKTLYAERDVGISFENLSPFMAEQQGHTAHLVDIAPLEPPKELGKLRGLSPWFFPLCRSARPRSIEITGVVI